MRRLRLSIEPIPQSTWGKSLANLMPRKEWDKIRKEAYKEADYQCEVCGEVNLPLFLHERWTWDEEVSIQRFAGFEVCCELCHDTHHLGRSKDTKTKAYVERLIKHWCKVNGETRKRFNQHAAEVYAVNRKRVNKYYVVKVGRRVLA